MHEIDFTLTSGSQRGLYLKSAFYCIINISRGQSIIGRVVKIDVLVGNLLFLSATESPRSHAFHFLNSVRKAVFYVWPICSHFWRVKNLQTFLCRSQDSHNTTIQHSAIPKNSGHSPSVPNSQTREFIVTVGAHSIMVQKSICWYEINECSFRDRVNKAIFSRKLSPTKVSYSC